MSIHVTRPSGRPLVGGCFLALVALVAACSPQGLTSLTQRLSVATGGTGGVYYPYGGGVAQVISDHLEGVEATAEVTAGTVDNLKFIGNRGADLAFAVATPSPSLARCRRAPSPFSTTTSTSW